MQFNNKFGMQDLFINKELKQIFPQFTKKDKLKNVYSFEWVDKKVSDYIKSAFNGRKVGDEIIIKGKFKDKFREIKALKPLLEDMFNNMPSITKNIRKNTKILTPFQSIEQLKNVTDPKSKMMVMQIILDNINFNPDFQSENRISKLKTPSYLRKQQKWLTSVGYFNLRR